MTARRKTIDLGGRTVELSTYGLAHTRGDQVVSVPDAGVVFVGDLAEERIFPIFPWFPPDDADIDADNWARVLAALEAAKPKIVVPGHGSVGGVEILSAVRDYMLDLGPRVAAELKAGEERRRRSSPHSARRCAPSIPTGMRPNGSISRSAISPPRLSSVRNGCHEAAMTKALIALHFQNDICHPDGLIPFAVDRSDRRRRSASSTGRGTSSPVRAKRAGWSPMSISPSSRTIPTCRATARLFRAVETLGALKRGSWGAAPMEGFEPATGDIALIHACNNAFHGTGLEEILRERGVTDVAVDRARHAIFGRAYGPARRRSRLFRHHGPRLLRLGERRGRRGILCRNGHACRRQEPRRDSILTADKRSSPSLGFRSGAGAPTIRSVIASIAGTVLSARTPR